jgi:glutamate-5-semialdehyde dehydrogenase
MTQATLETTINMEEMGQRARQASYALAALTTDQKNKALVAIADALEANTDSILAQNQLDIDAAEANGVDPIWVRDRIDLKKRMAGIIADVRKVAELPDPVGRIYDEAELPSGIRINRQRVPFGVIGTIYESRPNVTVDISTLALKTGNAVILRGGSDVLNSNLELVRVLQEALAENGIPADAIQYIASTNRDYVRQMLRLDKYIDMIIPRGGSGLHNFCRENSTIPVITGGIGVCHLYVDETANLDASLPVIHNAKTQRPAVCNALDTLLVHERVAAEFLPRVVENLGKDGVVFKAEPQALALLDDDRVTAAGADDFDTEWTALILGLKVVSDLDEAIDHIRAHSTQHSDGILTEDDAHAARFLNEIDSAAVFVNASTRFNDGGALGLGAGVAVSTQKMHARGPMALEELTTYKWIVRGDYTSRP